MNVTDFDSHHTPDKHQEIIKTDEEEEDNMAVDPPLHHKAKFDTRKKHVGYPALEGDSEVQQNGVDEEEEDDESSEDSNESSGESASSESDSNEEPSQKKPSSRNRREAKKIVPDPKSGNGKRRKSKEKKKENPDVLRLRNIKKNQKRTKFFPKSSIDRLIKDTVDCRKTPGSSSYLRHLIQTEATNIVPSAWKITKNANRTKILRRDIELAIELISDIN